MIDLLERKKIGNKKDTGRYLTPIQIAKFMADLFTPLKKQSYISILDPGAGIGILSIFLIKKLINTDVKNINLTVYEIDKSLINELEINLNNLKKEISRYGKELYFEIRNENFISKDTWNNNKKFDFVIANPPYKKLNKQDRNYFFPPEIVFGQPNLYYLFLAFSLKKLTQTGEAVYITPRSFTNGQYFSKFRKWLLKNYKIEHIHIFNSREKIFDNVLQELIIYKIKHKNFSKDKKITLSVSTDHIFFDYKEMIYKENDIIYGKEKFILIPANYQQHKAICSLKNLRKKFNEVGYEIKTGPIVPFRTEKLFSKNSFLSIPVIWTFHFDKHKIKFPSNNKKLGKKLNQQFIDKSSPKSLYLEKKNYLLLKRISSKDEKRRLQPNLFCASDNQFNNYKYVSFENHINYITTKNSKLSKKEMIGLFIIFNSDIYEKFYRALSGSTQVNSYDINNLPFFNKNLLQKIGEKGLKLLNKRKFIFSSECDKIIEKYLIKKKYGRKKRENKKITKRFRYSRKKNK